MEEFKNCHKYNKDQNIISKQHLSASTCQKVPIRRECDTVQGGVQGEVVPAARHPVQQDPSLSLDIYEC